MCNQMKNKNVIKSNILRRRSTHDDGRERTFNFRIIGCAQGLHFTTHRAGRHRRSSNISSNLYK